jgi:hypothetical protein
LWRKRWKWIAIGDERRGRVGRKRRKWVAIGDERRGWVGRKGRERVAIRTESGVTPIGVTRRMVDETNNRKYDQQGE